MPETSAQQSIDAAAVVSKFRRHVVPVLAVMYLIAYLDRQNVGFAKLQMAGDLNMTEYAYGLGSSLFFLGYLLFEIPSNIILRRVGAGRWFARIMVTWGVVTLGLAFTKNAAMFCVLRFLLGICEAGFFPGVLYLLTVWVPFEYRGRMTGIFISAAMLANALGGPICGTLLDADGVLGLRGWQWVFLATGLPAVLMGIAVPFLLPDGPEKAGFYTGPEKAWLGEKLTAEAPGSEKAGDGNPLTAMVDRRVLLIAMMFFCIACSSYGLSYWLPTIVNGFGVSNTVNGLLNAVPWVCVAAALWWVPAHAERTNESTWHVVIPIATGTVSLLGVFLVPGNSAKFGLLCLAAVGIYSCQPILWLIPSTFLKGASAAVGLAAINSLANLGGFAAQNAVPWIRDSTGSTLAPMIFLAGILVLAGCMTFVVRRALASAALP